MKLFFSLVAAGLALVMAYGCVPGLKGSKNQPNTQETKAQGPDGQSAPLGPGRQPAAGPQPQVPRPGLDTIAEGTSDFRLKDEINRSALEFAGKSVPHVKFIKTCYSQSGGWNLFAYAQRGKKTSFDQYVWNKESQQWELIYHQKDLPANQLEFHLKGEVGDEKCFVLK